MPQQRLTAALRLTPFVRAAALLLSSSCEEAGQRSALYALADRAVVSSGWTLAFADATARQLLELAAAKAALPSTPAAEAQAATP